MRQRVSTFLASGAARWCAPLLVVLCLAFPQAAAKHRLRDPGATSAQTVSDLHTAIVRVGKLCVDFHGYISDSWRFTLDGTFFDGLKRVDTADGPTFRKGPQVFTDFPDELYLRAYSAVGRCARDPRDLGPWPADFSPDLVRGLHAQGGYFRQGQRYPVEVSEVEEERIPFLWPRNTVKFPAGSYLWILNTKGVRLTDTLVVDLFSKDAAKVGQFTVDLAGRTGL